MRTIDWAVALSYIGWIVIDGLRRSKGTDKEQGVHVRPEHIHQALRQFAGITDHPFSQKFPLGVPEKETLRGLWGK